MSRTLLSGRAFAGLGVAALMLASPGGVVSGVSLSLAPGVALASSLPGPAVLLAAGGGQVGSSGPAASPAKTKAKKRTSAAPVSARPRVSLNARGGFGSVTPANGNARLAALLARATPLDNSMKFTPSAAAVRVNRSVTVAVRARSGTAMRAGAAQRLAMTADVMNASAKAGVGAVYDLGVSLGWRRFAFSGAMARVDSGIAGGRQAVDLGVSYNSRRWSSRIAVGKDSPLGTSRNLNGLNRGSAYSIDVGGSYTIVNDVALSAGLRYRSERSRLLGSEDNRHDSEAVYIGTVVRF